MLKPAQEYKTLVFWNKKNTFYNCKLHFEWSILAVLSMEEI